VSAGDKPDGNEGGIRRSPVKCAAWAAVDRSGWKEDARSVPSERPECGAVRPRARVDVAAGILVAKPIGPIRDELGRCIENCKVASGTRRFELEIAAR